MQTWQQMMLQIQILQVVLEFLQLVDFMLPSNKNITQIPNIEMKFQILPMLH
jgi:hypothetical protein